MGATRPQSRRVPGTPAIRLVVLVLLLGALTLGGCGKKHHILGDEFRGLYPWLSSPENVLSALAKAYTRRDSTEYRSLFDNNYTGTSYDQTAPRPQLLTFTKSDEARHIAGLAKTTTVTAVDLQLAPLVRLTDPGDPPGWALIQNPIQRLTIFDGSGVYDLPATAEIMEFRFIPTLDSSSPTDTTWKIIKWTEIRQ